MVDGVRYRVDAYDHKPKQFINLRDYFHGCDRCYDPEIINTHKNMKIKDLISVISDLIFLSNLL
jgi:hypothetical protein